MKVVKWDKTKQVLNSDLKSGHVWIGALFVQLKRAGPLFRWKICMVAFSFDQFRPLSACGRALKNDKGLEVAFEAEGLLAAVKNIFAWQ